MLLVSCGGEEQTPIPQDGIPAPPPNQEQQPAVDWTPTPDRRGSTIARDPNEARLYVADEDHHRLRIVPLPLETAATEVALPGPPAQVLALHDRVLVTVRDPGALLTYQWSDGELVLRQTVDLPSDAWGLAVTDDERTALVTSAWAGKLSAIDLAAGTVRWTHSVAREPRGIVVRGERAYVTHLVGTAITRVDGLDAEPHITRVDLPAGVFSQPLPDTFGEGVDTALGASLAYAPTLSPDGERLFVPRHALGGLGWGTWFGRPTVDVLNTGDDTPLAPARTHHGKGRLNDLPDGDMVEDLGQSIAMPRLWTVQPRASIYRQRTDTLLVVSEGAGWLTELDAHALDPSLHPFYRYELIHDGDDADRCGAPSGVALSPDEDVAYVWCRTTGEVAAVPLKDDDFAAGPDGEPEAPTYLTVIEEELPEAMGRRLFYDARSDAEDNRGVSGGLGCAGCHPDGRDDGHVWLESPLGALHGGQVSSRFEFPNRPILMPHIDGHARQTPMLAGRVEAEGPYGWRGEDETLPDRIRHGFAIHRWRGTHSTARAPMHATLHENQAEALAAFLRSMPTPAPERRPLTEEEQRGQRLFASDETGCANCHAAEDGFSNRRRYALPISRTDRGREESPNFRVPSLMFVGRTAPYLHDGRYDDLASLIDHIGDDMGSTSSLDASQRSALVAYLNTIGTVEDAPATPSPTQPLPFAPRKTPTSVSTPSPEPSSWPTVVTPEPTRAEWDAAPAMALRHMPDTCRAWRVREWVQIQCRPELYSVDEVDLMWRNQNPNPSRTDLNPRPEGVVRVALVAGARDDVRLRTEHRTGWNTEGVAIFPVRPGDRRFFEIDRQVVHHISCFRWRDWFQTATFTISESWTGDAPEIVVTRYGRHPSTGPIVVGHSCG